MRLDTRLKMAYARSAADGARRREPAWLGGSAGFYKMSPYGFRVPSKRTAWTHRGHSTTKKVGQSD